MARAVPLQMSTAKGGILETCVPRRLVGVEKISRNCSGTNQYVDVDEALANGCAAISARSAAEPWSRDAARRKNAVVDLHMSGHIAYTMQSGGDAFVPTSLGPMPGFNTPVGGLDEEWLDVGFGLSTVIGRSNRGETRIGGAYQGALFSSGYESHGLGLFLTSTF